MPNYWAPTVVPYALNVKEYGALGDGSTDDTSAVAAAIANIGTYASTNSERVQGRPALHVPRGRYQISSSIAVGFRDLTVIGEGMRNSVFNFTGSSGAVFELGAFSTTPASAFGGTAQGSHFHNVGFLNSTSFAATEGTRQAVGVRDNGSGDVHCRDVLFAGFSIGAALSYGGDFDVFDGCMFDNNDLGLYAANSSQQLQVRNSEFYTNATGIALMRNREAKIRDCWFINQSTADLSIEASTDRQSVTGLLAVEDRQNITISGCWHESQAGGLTARDAPRHIYVNTNEAIKGLLIEDALMYCSTASSATSGKAFLEMSANVDDVTIRRIQYRGKGLDYLVKRQSGQRVYLEDFQMASGATFGTAMCNDYTSTGLVTFGTHDGRQGAAPTTGHWAKGSVVWNNAPAVGQPTGWMCRVGGSPGTWTAMANL